MNCTSAQPAKQPLLRVEGLHSKRGPEREFGSLLLSGIRW